MKGAWRLSAGPLKLVSVTFFTLNFLVNLSQIQDRIIALDI